MKRCICSLMIVTLLIVGVVLDTAWAELFTQTLTLRPGWNAVFLEVEPESTDPAAVFAGVPVQSVWRWNPRTSPVEFIQDPDTLLPDQPQWMVYYPGSPVLTNLYTIDGETAYLINLGGTVDVQWSVSGEPTIPRIDWKPNSFNFVGFHFLPGSEPSFGSFFAPSLAHADQEIYVLVDGAWVVVDNPNVVQMQAGEAFWVYCKGSSTYTGPLSVQLDQGTGLHYGTTLVEQNLRVFNHSATDQTVHLNLPADPPLYLHYWRFDPDNDVAGWAQFPTANLDLFIPAGEMQTLRLGVRRAELTPGATVTDNLYLINDDASNWFMIPVSVTGIDHYGLWSGQATIRKVSEPASGTDPDTPTETGSEFSFRLIVHVDDGGQTRLLREVIQLWQEGTWKPDPNDLGKLIPDDPGHFVLIANDGLLPQYAGAALRDGQPVGRRISSPAFGFTGPQPMSGNFELGSDLTVNLVLPSDDPVNPFRHKYHPDHKTAAQSYEITRQIILEFTDTDDQGRPITGVPVLSWGSSEIGGIYKEAILGLHKEQINVEGTFVLKRTSNVAQLLF